MHDTTVDEAAMYDGDVDFQQQFSGASGSNLSDNPDCSVSENEKVRKLHPHGSCSYHHPHLMALSCQAVPSALQSLRGS